MDELLFIVWSRSARLLVDIHARPSCCARAPATPGAGWMLKLLLRKLPILRIVFGAERWIPVVEGEPGR